MGDPFFFSIFLIIIILFFSYWAATLFLGCFGISLRFPGNISESWKPGHQGQFPICAHPFRLDLISKNGEEANNKTGPTRKKKDETKIESNRVLIAVFPIFHLRVIVAEDAGCLTGPILTGH